MNKEKIYKQMKGLKFTEIFCIYTALILLIPFMIMLVPPIAKIGPKIRQYSLITLGSISAFLLFIGGICTTKFAKLNNKLFLFSIEGKYEK